MNQAISCIGQASPPRLQWGSFFLLFIFWAFTMALASFRTLRVPGLVLALAAFAGSGAMAQLAPTAAGPAAPVGEIKGTALVHTAESARGVMAGAQVALPASVTGGAPYLGPLRGAPAQAKARVPVVVFLHGSSGLGLKAIEEWQRWLATMGVASVAPNSFALPERLTYTSPIGKPVYEQVHALRGSEIDIAVAGLGAAPWADAQRLVLAGTSEGATAVARHAGPPFAGRMIYAWSCEDNYFVAAHGTRIAPHPAGAQRDQRHRPVLLAEQHLARQPRRRGHCVRHWPTNKSATIVLIPRRAAHAAEPAGGAPRHRGLCAGFSQALNGAPSRRCVRIASAALPGPSTLA
jgi:hypothetical protein